MIKILRENLCNLWTNLIYLPKIFQKPFILHTKKCGLRGEAVIKNNPKITQIKNKNHFE